VVIFSRWRYWIKTSSGGWMMLELELSYPEFDRYNIEIISWSDKNQLVALTAFSPMLKTIWSLRCIPVNCP